MGRLMGHAGKNPCNKKSSGIDIGLAGIGRKIVSFNNATVI
jgi:hypothetical protein